MDGWKRRAQANGPNEHILQIDREDQGQALYRFIFRRLAFDFVLQHIKP